MVSGAVSVYIVQFPWFYVSSACVFFLSTFPWQQSAAFAKIWTAHTPVRRFMGIAHGLLLATRAAHVSYHRLSLNIDLFPLFHILFSSPYFVAVSFSLAKVSGICWFLEWAEVLWKKKECGNMETVILKKGVMKEETWTDLKDFASPPWPMGSFWPGHGLVSQALFGCSVSGKAEEKAW